MSRNGQTTARVRLVIRARRQETEYRRQELRAASGSLGNFLFRRDFFRGARFFDIGRQAGLTIEAIALQFAERFQGAGVGTPGGGFIWQALAVP